MTDRIEQIIQEYADCPDDFDIKKVAAEIRELAIQENMAQIIRIANSDTMSSISTSLWMRENHKCSYCGHVGPDVIQYIGKIGGSDEPRTIICCSDIDACLKRIQNTHGLTIPGGNIQCK